MNKILDIFARRPALATVIVCVALYLVAGFASRNFFTVYNAVNFFQEYAYVGIVAVGVTFVILTGGIDLSVGAIVGWSTVVMGSLIAHQGYHPFFAMAVVLLTTTTGGALMGAMIHYFMIPPFLLTLGAMFLYRGWALVIFSGEIPIKHEGLVALANPLVNLPVENVPVRLHTFVLLSIFVLGAVIGRLTAFGRSLYAIGGSENSALLMGLPVARNKTMVYAVSGFCAGLAGIAMTVKSLNGQALQARGLELEAIAVSVMGGTLLSGGVGGVVGTFIGLIIFAIINTVMSFHNFDPAWARIAIGGLLLAFILLQKVLQARRV